MGPGTPGSTAWAAGLHSRTSLSSAEARRAHLQPGQELPGASAQPCGHNFWTGNRSSPHLCQVKAASPPRVTGRGWSGGRQGARSTLGTNTRARVFWDNGLTSRQAGVGAAVWGVGVHLTAECASPASSRTPCGLHRGSTCPGGGRRGWAESAELGRVRREPGTALTGQGSGPHRINPQPSKAGSTQPAPTWMNLESAMPREMSRVLCGLVYVNQPEQADPGKQSGLAATRPGGSG